MEEILGLPDSIPQDLLDKAECVIVVPSLTKVAVCIGGSYGRGATVCPSGANKSAAAGPKGRDTERLHRWIPARSRCSVIPVRAVCSPECRSEGTSLRPDDDASAEIYGHKVTARSCEGRATPFQTPAVVLLTCSRRKRPATRRLRRDSYGVHDVHVRVYARPRGPCSVRSRSGTHRVIQYTEFPDASAACMRVTTALRGTRTQ